jgi:hypothetical protein
VLRFIASPEEWKGRSTEDRDFGASHDLEQTQRVGDFLIAPLIAADDGDSEEVDLRGLEQHQQRLHVAAAGAGTILIENDFAPLLLRPRAGTGR